MGATGLIARAEWRRSAGSLLVMALIVAVGGGLAMAAAAGARRADTAFERFLAVTGTGNIDVAIVNGGDTAMGQQLVSMAGDLAAIPGVENVRSIAFVAMQPDLAPTEIPPFSGINRRLSGPDLPEYLVVEGRRADPTNPQEIVINETAAQMMGIGPGDEVGLRSLAPEQFDAWMGEAFEPPRGPKLNATVVGIVRTGEDISDAPEPMTMATPAFLDTYGDEVLHCLCLLTLRADPARVAEVAAAAAQLVGPQGFSVSEVDESVSRRIDDAVELETDALRVAAIVGVIATALVLVQVLARYVTGAAGSLSALPAIGATRTQRLGVWAVVSAPFAVLGACGALLVALVASPHLPRGLAASAEPNPGVHVDGAVFVLGFLGIVATVLLCTLAVALVAGRRRSSARAVSASSWYKALPPEGRLGTRMAVGSGSRGGRAGMMLTIAAGALAIGAVVAVAVLHRSIDRALATPSAYGADWDYELRNDPEDPEAVIGALVADSGVDALGLVYGSTLGGTTVSGPAGVSEVSPMAIDNIKGYIGPLLSRGRMPATSDEVVLGPTVARRLGVQPGDEVRVVLGQDMPEVRYVVAGVGRFADDDENDLTFFTTLDGLQRALAEDASVGQQAGLVRLARDAGSSTTEALTGFGFVPPSAPSNLDNLRELGEVPALVAAAMVLLGLGGLAHALILGARRGRRELAIASALGFTRRQLSRISSWQAGVLAVAVIAIGIPIGVVVGRTLWSWMASGVSATPLLVIPWSVIAVAVLAAAAVATLMATLVGRRARRIVPALALRGE